MAAEAETESALVSKEKSELLGTEKGKIEPQGVESGDAGDISPTSEGVVLRSRAGTSVVSADATENAAGQSGAEDVQAVCAERKFVPRAADEDTVPNSADNCFNDPVVLDDDVHAELVKQDGTGELLEKELMVVVAGKDDGGDDDDAVGGECRGSEVGEGVMVFQMSG